MINIRDTGGRSELMVRKRLSRQEKKAETRARLLEAAGVALGGVAPKPWRARAAEEVLLGDRLDAAAIAAAGAVAVRGARPLRDNAFKVRLAERAVVRALSEIGGAA